MAAELLGIYFWRYIYWKRKKRKKNNFFRLKRHILLPRGNYSLEKFTVKAAGVTQREFCINMQIWVETFKSESQEKWQFHIFGYFSAFKEYPQKSQIRKSKTSPNQGTWLGIPRLGLVSLCQIWDFYGYSLNILKYPIMGICYFFLWIALCHKFYCINW